MRILLVTIQLALAAFLISCDQQDSAIGIDPGMGLECYESHRASLPPGTQYEGIEKVAENRLTIKIMDGIDVTTTDCVLNPDGTLQGADK
jgi:hypothetical protein